MLHVWSVLRLCLDKSAVRLCRNAGTVPLLGSVCSYRRNLRLYISFVAVENRCTHRYPLHMAVGILFWAVRFFLSTCIFKDTDTHAVAGQLLTSMHYTMIIFAFEID